MASSGGFIDVVKSLIERGANLDSASKVSTALHRTYVLIRTVEFND